VSLAAGKERDAVGLADRARRETTARIADVLATAPEPPRDVHIGWGAALDVRGCPARYRSQGAGGWGFPGWSAPLAAGAVARAALAHHLARDAHLTVPAGHDHRLAAGPPPAPLELVRGWMRDARRDRRTRSVAGWVGDRWSAGDHATLAATAALASRWLAGFLRVVGWPLPAGTVLLGAGDSPALRWRPAPRSPVTVASGTDARIGRVTGGGAHVYLVHRVTSGDDDTLRDRAAFEAAATTLAVGVAPAEIQVTCGDTGERARLDVDDDLVADGIGMIVAVVHERLRSAAGAGPDDGATPSSRCRWCERVEECGPGRARQRSTGRWRDGLPLVAPAPDGAGG